MRNYFEDEMRLFYEAAQRFAKSYPEQAALLNLESMRDRDPHVERLLEGVAFLTAQIRQRIDDDLPDISANLLAQLWPQFLRPFPSATIMQFKSRPGQLQQTTIIPAETITHSHPVGEEKLVCQFRTVSALKMQPIQIMAVETTESINKNILIRISLQFEPNAIVDNLDLSDLRFYLQGDLTLALELYTLLNSQIKKVRVVFSQNPILQPVILGDQSCIKPCHLAVEECLLPLSGRCFQGFQLLLDYFSFREKFLFVSLYGLDKIKWPKQTQQFIVEIECTGSFSAVAMVNKKNFQLHCVPAINLYSMRSEPIQLTQTRVEYPIIVDNQHPEGILLFNIDAVYGQGNHSMGHTQLFLMHTFQHKQSAAGFYSVQYRDCGMDVMMPYLIVSNKQKKQQEILSCAITVCNKHYPRHFLPENSQHFLSQHATFIVCNITRPTPLLLPPTKSDWQWRLVSLLSLNYQTLTDLSVFKELLQLYVWSDRAELTRKINAITHIDIQTVSSLQRGLIMRGLEIYLAVNEEGFISFADIYLYGTVLHQFFKLYASINYTVQLKIMCYPSQREYLWNMSSGTNLPL